MSKYPGFPKTPTYSNGGTPVSTGDSIRFKQAPGGILPSSASWTYGTVVESEGNISTHVIESHGRKYNLLGHIIERA